MLRSENGGEARVENFKTTMGDVARRETVDTPVSLKLPANASSVRQVGFEESWSIIISEYSFAVKCLNTRFVPFWLLYQYPI
jgi:hypothetical protein